MFSRRDLDKPTEAEGKEVIGNWTTGRNEKKKWYDRFEAVKLMQESLEKIMDKAPDLYGATQRYLAIAPAKLKDLKFKVDDLVEGMKKDDVDDKTLSLYMYAVHAPERNAELYRRSTEFTPENLKKLLMQNGMTEKQVDADLIKARARLKNTVKSLKKRSRMAR
ncbi:hypothetical protein THIOSC15_1950003 [uncultured Thiomicrorhabdus sp.]